MTSWKDESFTYRGFHCIWNHETQEFEIRESGSAYFIGRARTAARAKFIIDKEVGR